MSRMMISAAFIVGPLFLEPIADLKGQRGDQQDHAVIPRPFPDIRTIDPLRHINRCSKSAPYPPLRSSAAQ